MKTNSMKLVAFAMVCVAASAGLAAEWIAGTYCPPPESDEPAFFAPARNDVVERAFRTRDAEVASATWRVAAPGMRDLFVNGERVSSTALPPLTPYRKRILEETFDVTAQVRRDAENALRIELGNGWYNLLPLKMWYAYNLREHMATGTPCVKATLEIAYADGVREKVETDASWLAAKGRLVHNSIYLGVVEDRRLSVDFAEKARVVDGPRGRVVDSEAFPKVVVYDNWKARSVAQISNGVWLVDMGVNATGTLRARLRGVPKDAKIRLRQGERIWPDGTVNVMTAVAGQIKNPAKGPLFAVAEQRDSVIGDGSQEFVFEPRMTFHVFRYVQVEGPCAAPKPEDFEICAWSADVRERSRFTCSNERLNKLHEICRRTFRSNLQGVQSDCPGREKFGYGGDIACTLDAFWSNYDMADFYRKTLRDFLDEAEDDGLFTETAPFVGIASRSVYPADGQTPNSMLAERGTRAAPIGWAVGVPVIVDSLVRYDGDLDSVRLAYPALVRFIDLVSRRYPSNDLPECLGDWIAIEPEKANCGLSGLAHWHQFVALTAKFARLLGKANDAERLAKLSDRIAAKFRADYVHESGRVGSGFQGEQLFALYHGLLDPKDVPEAYSLLKKDIHAHGDALTTGIFATKYMLEYLPLHGDATLAARVAMHEGFPGWFHMMDRGATTLWENWSEEKSVNVHSNCHPMFGSVDEWMVRHVLGISVCEDAVGCDKVRIAPQPIPGVTSASGWFDTPKGRISVSWKVVDGKLDVKSDVPGGIKVVPLPSSGKQEAVISACCLQAGSMASWNAASVVDVGGVPRFAIDGRPMTATAVMPSPAGRPGAAHEQLKAFRDAGAMLSSDVWTMHDKRYNPRQWWLDEGEYDFELFDAIAKGLVDAAPDGFIFPRIKIDPPQKWCEAHPDEMMSAISPRPESMAWRALYRRMLKDVIDHVERSSYAGNVIGYHIGAFHCGEWLTGEWKAENRAYIPPVACGDDDPLPPLEVTAARRAAISQRADAVADMLIDAASCVKEFTGGRRLVGAFFGYPSIAHEKVLRVICSGKVDFFAAPPHYFAAREPGHSGRSQAYYQASYRLHGRVYYEESDFRTFLSEQSFSPPNQTRRRPLDESIGIVRRSIGKCLAGGWENWWFLLGGNDTFAAPELMESIRIGAKEERETLFAAQWKPAEVAVFTAADEYATSAGTHAPEFRLACKENLHRNVLPACGVPFDSYELGDIADPRLPDYKVYMFPNAFTLSEELRAKIRERTCGAGKTAIFVRSAAECFKTPAQLRKAFRDAGAHVWIDTDDVFAVGRGYVMVHAASDGRKTIRLQRPCDVSEIFGASLAQTNVTSILEWMKRGETRVWRVK